MNAQWLGDILLGNFEALRLIQCSRYTAFSLQDPFAPTQHLVSNLLGKWSLTGLSFADEVTRRGFPAFCSSQPLSRFLIRVLLPLHALPSLPALARVWLAVSQSLSPSWPSSQ